MPKEVSALNTYWLVRYLHERHPDLDLQDLVDRVSGMFPCYVENLQTGKVEQVSLDHLQTPRYWFSHRFVKALHDLIEVCIPDPILGFKIGSTMYKTQPLVKTALGIPLLGTHKVANRVSREAAKYNRTKQYHVQELRKGFVLIRITHTPGIVVSEFTMQWNAGCFASYARLAGATEIQFKLHCIDSGPDSPGDISSAIWDIELRYQEPGLLIRLSKAVFYNLPWLRELVERAEALEEEHQEQILNRDNIIRERTADLATLNEKLRIEVAERRLAEETLLQSKEHLERYITAIDDIGMGLCVIDADHRVRDMNTTLVAWFGDHRGKTCHGMLMGLDHPCSHCKLQDVVTHGTRVRYHSTSVDGRSFESVVTPVKNSDGTISVMEIIRDITEQKQRQEQRIKISRQKEELKKLDSLRTMAGAVAHRFNNAMVGVQGNLELMTFALPHDSKEYKMALLALQSARGASQVGSMMLSYVGQQPLQLRECSFSAFVCEIITAFRHRVPSPFTLRCIPPSQPLYCSFDREQMQKVAENVLQNAIESLDGDSGTVEVTFGTGHFEIDSFPLSFQGSNLKDGNYAYCRIEDSGHGIHPENIQQIFEPFYTTRFVGRGLGLALAVGIMRLHNGAVLVESEPETGTTVRILLPFTASQRC